MLNGSTSKSVQCCVRMRVKVVFNMRPWWLLLFFSYRKFRVSHGPRARKWCEDMHAAGWIIRLFFFITTHHHSPGALLVSPSKITPRVLHREAIQNNHTCSATLNGHTVWWRLVWHKCVWFHIFFIAELPRSFGCEIWVYDLIMSRNVMKPLRGDQDATYWITGRLSNKVKVRKLEFKRT